MKSINQTSENASLGKRHFEGTQIFHPIHYKTTGKDNWYEQDLEYFKQHSFPIDSLPFQVQLEHYFKAKIHAQSLVTFQNEHGYFTALTGLRKTLIPDWFYGDLRAFVDGKTITSLVLVYFSPDNSVFKLYLFENYYPEGRKRIREILNLIRELIVLGKPTNQDSTSWFDANPVALGIEQKIQLET